ncbi:MAG: TPR end-of-group domain-containing protein, partial [Planctomycetota bacterium]
MKTWILAAGIVGFLLLPAFLSARLDPPDATADRAGPHRRAFKYFKAGKYRSALQMYASILKKAPDDEIALYNTACIFAILGKRKDAAAYLVKAVEAGFHDFDHIEKDKDLDVIRSEEGYVSILKRKGEILAREKEEQIDEYRKQLGKEYVFDQAEALNVLLVSKLDAGRRKRYLASLRRHA